MIIKSTNYASSGVSEKNTLQGRNMRSSKINLLETKEFWEEIVTELKELQLIIAGKDKKPTDEIFYDAANIPSLSKR